jgi:hypothetical protein
VLDRDSDGIVTLEEFTSAILALYTGGIVEIAKLLFKIIDFSKKGAIT